MKKNIAIIGGGNSSEEVVSVKSAAQLLEMMDADKYTLYNVYIRQDDWHVNINGEKYPINKADFSFEFNGTVFFFDCVYITIHGTPGEDGILQSYFDLIGLPYTSCSAFASSLTFNKFATKAFLNEYGVKSAKGLLFRKGDEIDADFVAESLGLPCFIKPNNGGSSFGVSKVEDKNEIVSAITHALTEGDEIIIESFLSGREFTNGAYIIGDQVNVLPITEIVSENDFFDYEAKYVGKSSEITPAELTPEEEEACKKLTRKIYKALGCSGIVRVDYIKQDDEFYLLEINTAPGMSKQSIIPQQIRAEGLEPKDVFSAVIENALTDK